jgi:phage gpG-like protein
MEGSRERILEGRDWTGRPFVLNSVATLFNVMRRAVGEKGLYTKRGKLRVSAAKAISRKKPLIDRGTFVRSRLYYQADRNSVIVGASAKQAAVLQFGAKKGAFGATRRGAKIPWGDIPARRYFPVTEDGQIDDAARSLILDAIRAYLADE